MAGSLIGGLIAEGYPPQNIWVSDTDAEKRKDIAGRFGVNTAADNRDVVKQARVLVLAVKPQIMQSVALEIAQVVREQAPVVISIAAGVTVAALSRWLGAKVAIVRCMPNTPALVRTGASALYASPETTEVQRSRAEAILRSVGLTVWVSDEVQMDGITALSGSGPAYFFLLMEAMEDAGVALGLNRPVARLLAQQTALGAGRIAIESEESPADLRRRVTSPGGTTEQAVDELERGGFKGLIGTAMGAAARRAAELSMQLGS